MDWEFGIMRCELLYEVLVTQLYPTLCDPMNYSLPGSLSFEFSRHEYQSVLPFPSPGDLPAAVKSLQSCPTLCNPIDGSPPGSPIPGILQARTLEWVAIAFSGDLPDQGSNPGLPHCRQILYCLSHQGMDKQQVLLYSTGNYIQYPG